MDNTGARPLLPLLHWGEPSVTDQGQGDGDLLLPVGTVTLLLADVEGSTRLWETQPAEMTAAVARLDEIVSDAVGRHRGVRPVEQGEGDSFVAAFSRASDAVAAALDLQRADSAPVRLRIGIHTGEVQLRDEGNYIGSPVNRCARLRDLGHGGQTLLSAATRDLVVDALPDGVWLVDLGTHRLRDLARPERVHQVCHPDLVVDFAALRSLDTYRHNLPVQLTSFVGRHAEMTEVRGLLSESRLLTLTGSGGAGKTRLALQLAANVLSEFRDGVWFVELASLVDADLVATAVGRALGLRDEPARRPLEAILGHLADRQALLILDNCEHLVRACAEVTEEVLSACPAITVLATSREPLGVAGELAWRVPSLTVPKEVGSAEFGGVNGDDAVQLFVERAQRARPGFELTNANRDAVAQICRRVDGIPLAIELAAARVRVFAPDQIAGGLDDRFRLLTGGTRTAVPRQQTLRASVDWSYDLLTDPERILFRRLGVFSGSFDFTAAQAVCARAGLEAHQVLDQLSLLIDKSLVLTDETDGESRYRLLETVRHYSLERLGASGEQDDVRHRHRDHYLTVAESAGDGVLSRDQDRWLDRLTNDLDNFRAAFQWSVGRSDIEEALRLAASLEGLWINRNRFVEGRRVWFDAVRPHTETASLAVRTQALTTGALVYQRTFSRRAPTLGDEAVAAARELADDHLLARALVAAGYTQVFFGDRSWPSFREAIELTTKTGDAWSLVDAQAGLASSILYFGDPREALPLAAQGRTLALQIGHRHAALTGAVVLGQAKVLQGDLADGRSLLEDAAVEAQSIGAWGEQVGALGFAAVAAAAMGDVEAARAAAEESVRIAHETRLFVLEGAGWLGLGIVALSDGDASAARTAFGRGLDLLSLIPFGRAFAHWGLAEAELAAGELGAARDHADAALAGTKGTFHGMALLASARVGRAEGDRDQAERVAHQALATLLEVTNKHWSADTLELLATLAAEADSHHEAARLFGAAHSVRRGIAYRRTPFHQTTYTASLATVRGAISDNGCDAAWAEGAALSLDEAVAYANRGRGERKRPSAGWASLTPTERDVVRLVAEGLANKEIAQQLFVSYRTVQTHLTHIYAKLGINSRVQLAQQAAHRG